mgnify:CR=1 FL=1
MSKEIVFDIETIGDISDYSKLKVTVISLYRYETNTFESYTEHELGKVWPLFERAERLIGYNSEHFDLPVLNNYYMGDLLLFPHLDLLKKIKESLGIRLKLKDVAEATLDDVTKSADGLQAMQWYKEGKIDEIKKYCEQDVNVTKQLYEFGRDNKQLFYKTLTGEVMPFFVDYSAQAHIDPTKKVQPKKTINLTLPF